jgi:hypothetical protein
MRHTVLIAAILLSAALAPMVHEVIVHRRISVSGSDSFDGWAIRMLEGPTC